MKIKQFTSLLIISFVFVCCSKETDKEATATVNASKQEQVKPGDLITLEKAKEQIDNYNAAHPEEVGEDYALRTWISIEELKAYIQYIEAQSKEKGIEVSGIDFIHTQHKKAEPGSANPKNEVYDLTLMMAPTYKDGVIQTAFDPIYSEQGKPKSLKSLLDEMTINTGPEAANKTENSAKPSSMANNLSTCPSICN